MNKYADPKPIRYWNNGFQSDTGMRWYRTEIPDADAGGIGPDADAQL
jgi:hypothetical protein